MLDFITVTHTYDNKKNVVEIYPKLIVKKPLDLMIRGGDFYAIWDEEKGLWSTDEQDALRMIDQEVKQYKEDNKFDSEATIKTHYMWDAASGMIDRWHKYCQKQLRDSFEPLDEKIIFSNEDTKKQDYASKKLPYPLDGGSIEAYDKLMSTLYSEEERHKIEWAIGAIVTGDSKTIQKFMVLYGAAGTGKSTILNIIQQLFEGYYSVFDAKALGSSSNSFALGSFRTNPLVAIQHDGDLSKIEDNTRLNSLVSHELMEVNDKFKQTYATRFNAFLFMGTNKPVKITDGKSGLLRRLIDVSPTGKKLNPSEYKKAVGQIKFELGAIASHCREVYLSNPGAYDDYIPTTMMSASNDFYNFVIDSYHIFLKEDGTTLKAAWEMYKTYCDEAKISYPFSQRVFKEELKNYFWEFKERAVTDDGLRMRSYYSGFRVDKFEDQTEERVTAQIPLIRFDTDESIFDKEYANCLAQYASNKETPTKKWENVKTTLSSLKTSRLHYVQVPENHIVIDFDIKDQDGNKSLEENIKAASKWPSTYAELSKSGAGVHLHYIYKGDVSKLSRVYGDDIEVKVFSGNSSLRRKLTKCNNTPIATISSGLPLKGDDKMIDFEAVKSEKALRTLINKNLHKEIHPGTKPSIDFIDKILNDAYSSGLAYDVSNMKNEVLAFAANSTNQSDYCIKMVNQMKFKSEEPSNSMVSEADGKIIFFDVEVFPNLFLVNWKMEGENKPIVRMINPKPNEIEELLRFNLVGYNCRRYDNHILYGGLIGYSNEQIYALSQKIINGERNAFFGEAYNISYTDVYDFASAGNKKSLKKLEIEMGNISDEDLKKKGFSDSEIRIIKAGTHHQELGLPWDKPVPEEKWIEVAEYCDNDVIATEASFLYLKADWTARQILADLAGMSVNDTTNTLTTRIIFGNNRKPQDQFNYRNLAEPVHDLDERTYEFLSEAAPAMVSTTHGEKGSLLPYFPGYRYDGGVSIYREEKVGEGGYVYAEPGMYTNVALLDVASMHPSSIIDEVLFGSTFTTRFKEIKDARVYIKHEAWDTVNTMLDGKLQKYTQKVIDGEMTSKNLADALKTAINSVYGLTAASFENAFHDNRNRDNIVAKRGALFMIDLKHEIQLRGFTVAHIKTDSIKIPNATPDIIKFVMEFGERYGYTFEHEATYEKMCLVNQSTYIAKYKDGKHAGEWSATGAQFAVPYVFKKLFSKESIVFDDLCETKSVTSALYLDMNEGLPDMSALEKEYEKLDKQYRDENGLYPLDIAMRMDELKNDISQGHNYCFVGKIGRFCPIKPGMGGGLLCREKDGKYYAATGSKGYRWLESEMVKELGKEDTIDRSYYDSLVDEAIEEISKHGDVEMFLSDDTL